MICRKRISMIILLALLLIFISENTIANVTTTATILGPDVILKDKATSYSATVAPAGTHTIKWQKSTDGETWPESDFATGPSAQLTHDATGKIYIRLKVDEEVIEQSKKAIDVVDITLNTISGASLITGAQNDYVALRSDQNSITVSLSITPSDFSLPGNSIQWPIGTAPESGDQLQRIISKAAVELEGIDIKPTLNNVDIISETLYVVYDPNDAQEYALSYEKDTSVQTGGNFGASELYNHPSFLQYGVTYSQGSWQLLLICIESEAKWNTADLGRIDIPLALASSNQDFTQPSGLTPRERREKASEDFEPIVRSGIYSGISVPYPARTVYWSELYAKNHEEAHCVDWQKKMKAEITKAKTTIEAITQNANNGSPKSFHDSQIVTLENAILDAFVEANRVYFDGNRHEFYAWRQVEIMYDLLSDQCVAMYQQPE